jgi:isopentenyl diphosphate isomerase/L-lactate dehydrogenase-like FMN-dependent dehydrogenase
LLKMPALGADAVMIGRLFRVAALGGGKKGVPACLARLKAELTKAMIMTATAKASEVGREVIRQKG